jgi:hypothetical protein
MLVPPGFKEIVKGRLDLVDKFHSIESDLNPNQIEDAKKMFIDSKTPVKAKRIIEDYFNHLLCKWELKQKRRQA